MLTNKAVSSWLVLLCVMSMLSGCISIPAAQPDKTNPIATVAILPFVNQSNNVDAPKQIRELLRKKLISKFYQVLPLEDVDQTLSDRLGVTLGEQLSEIDFDDIKASIAADAYVYGDIMHYDQSLYGIINTNRVSTKFTMLESSDGSVFWSNNIGIKSESRSGSQFADLASVGSVIKDARDTDIKWITISRRSAGDGSVMGNLISGLVETTLSSAFGILLKPESLALVNISTMTLRNGPGL